MRSAIYARKSTKKVDRQVHSIKDQLKNMRELARSEGFNVVETFQESVSAKAPGTRPEFMRMIEMVQRGEIDAILTWSPSRLSRNEVDGGWLSYLLQTGALRLIRTPERTYRPEDSSVLFAIENAQSTDYVRNLRKDVTRGMREKAQRGWHTSKAPLGYLNDAETRHIVPDPERFDLVRKGWDMLLSGEHSVSEIHRRLVTAGLSVRVRERETDLPVSHSKLYETFHSRTYVGEVPYKGEWLPGRHAPMVTEDEFRQAQDIMGRFGRGKKAEKKTLAFGGLFRCAVCGCAVVGETKRKVYPRTGRVVVYTYYHCSGSKGCTKAAVREEDLIDLAWKTALAFRATKSTADWLADAVIDCLEREAVGTAESLAELERRMDQDESRLHRLSRMRLEGEIGSDENARLRAEILDRQADLRQSIHDARDRAGRVVRLIAKKLDACVASGEIENLENDPRVLAKVLAKAGDCRLNLFPFDFRLDPILAKIAAFEPLRDGSEKPERGDSIPLFSVWWALALDLLNLATEEVKFLEERRARMTYQDCRWDDEHGWGQL